MDNESQPVLEAITEHFVRSRDFNGILASQLAEQVGLSQPTFITVLERLLTNEEIAIAFNRYQGNPHILRFPSPDTQRQLELLRSEPPDEFCLYPTAKVLIHREDLAAFTDRPFIKRLALGEAQLTPVFFELSALEPYYRDPRYLFQYGDMGGRISIRDEAGRSSDVHDRDKIFLQTFGIAYDGRRNRVVIVYLRYLADLSPEHQQTWNARAVQGPCEMNSGYARASLYGDLPEHYSAYRAFLTEIEEINKLSALIGNRLLFRDDFSAGRPTGLHPMLRPTGHGLQEFVHLLDKMLSENLNRDFFRNDIPLEEELAREDGRVQVVPLGTLRLLRNWLSKHYRTADDADVSDEIVGPLKRIRYLRQKPAHAIDEDKFDISLPGQQDKLLIDVLKALQKLRLVLMSHPRARGKYQPPDWLDGDQIVMY
ncbi:MAG: AAA family ATPase [Nitrospirota bacterium]